jgi:lambda repressor-like predicted transcriptional regulator
MERKRRLTPIKLQLQMKGQTQRWLSKETGIGISMVWLFCNGLIPNDDTQLKIAEILNVKVQELWD